MRRIETILASLASPGWLAGYLASLVLMLGWSANRSYLNWFGIDAGTLDIAADETYANFFGWGLRAFRQSEVWFPSFLLLAFVLFWVLIPDIMIVAHRSAWGSRLSRILPLRFQGVLRLNFFRTIELAKAKNIWTIVSLALLIVVVPNTFLWTINLGETSGEIRAQIEYKEDFKVFRPIAWERLPEDILPPINRGCWRKLTMDKESAYLFWSLPPGENRPERPIIYIVPLEKITGVRIAETCETPKSQNTDKRSRAQRSAAID